MMSSLTGLCVGSEACGNLDAVLPSFGGRKTVLPGEEWRVFLASSPGRRVLLPARAVSSPGSLVCPVVRA